MLVPVHNWSEGRVEISSKRSKPSLATVSSIDRGYRAFLMQKILLHRPPGFARIHRALELSVSQHP